MKLNNTLTMKRKAGMTLLELTVVILVLLSLISILFVGARAWKKGSDRSANIMNIRNCQQAMRGHQNMHNVSDAAVLAASAEAAFDSTTLQDYMKVPTGVADVTYTPGAFITPFPADPVADYAHIWLQPSATGQPGALYGQNSLEDSAGW